MRLILIFLLFFLTENYCTAQYSKDRYHTKASMAANHIASYQIYDMTETAEYFRDSTLAEELWFDEKGNLSKETDYRHDMTITVTYDYDKQDRLIETKTNSPDMDIFETTSYVYEKNMLVSVICHNADQHITLQTDNTYRDELMTESKTTYDNGKSFITTYTYNEKHQLVEEYVPSIERKTTYGYDGEGNLVAFIFEENDRIIKDTFAVENKLRVGQLLFINGKPDQVYKMVYRSGLIREEQTCTSPNEGCKFTSRYYYQYRK